MRAAIFGGLARRAAGGELHVAPVTQQHGSAPRRGSRPSALGSGAAAGRVPPERADVRVDGGARSVWVPLGVGVGPKRLYLSTRQVLLRICATGVFCCVSLLP